MSRQRVRIRAAVEAKGYTMVSADWQPIGQQVEMAGREGGWTVLAEPHAMAVGYSTDDVLDWINRFWEPAPDSEAEFARMGPQEGP